MSRPSFVEAMLVCSAAHVPEPVLRRLEDMGYGTDYGAQWSVNDLAWETEEIVAGDWPPELAALSAFARSHDCCWVKLDCDAEEIAGLPTYDWGAAA